MTKFDISSNDFRAEGGKALAEGLKGNQVIKELNFSGNKLGYDPSGYTGTSGIIAIADVIPGMGAMTSLHIGMNHIPEKEMTEIIALAMGTASMELLCEVPIKDKSLTELDVSSKSLGTEGALVVAEYLRDNGALSKLIFGGDMYRISLLTNNHEEVIPEPAILEVGMTEADFSNKNLGAGGATIISAWITHKDKGALSSLNLASNAMLSKESGKALADVLKSNSVLTELDVSDNQDKWSNGSIKGQLDGAGFTKELAAGISDNGALSSANLLKNYIPVEQAQELVKIMRAKQKLATLCGLSGKETELDFSGQNLGAGDAVLIANDIKDNGALSKLIFGGDTKRDASTKWEEVPYEPVTLAVGKAEADFSNKNLGTGSAIIIG
jgi:hypothetical protein